MDRPLVISDRLTAAGFRLAGLSTLVTAPAALKERFRSALTQDGPILITADLAAMLPPGELQQAIARARPPVAVITDLSNHAAPPDLGGRVRRALGVET